MIHVSSRLDDELFRKTIEELERRRVTGTPFDHIAGEAPAGQMAPGVARLQAALKERFGEPRVDDTIPAPNFRFLFELSRNTTYIELGSKDGRHIYVDFLTTPLFMRSITPSKETCRALWLPREAQEALRELKRIALEAGALDRPAA
ncbi:MAG TPA: hypothetical protein VIK92_04190 [Thermaerobacter sp.]